MRECTWWLSFFLNMLSRERHLSLFNALIFSFICKFTPIYGFKISRGGEQRFVRSATPSPNLEGICGYNQNNNHSTTNYTRHSMRYGYKYKVPFKNRNSYTDIL